MYACLAALALPICQPQLLADRVMTLAVNDLLGGQWDRARSRLQLASRLQPRRADWLGIAVLADVAIRWSTGDRPATSTRRSPLLPPARNRDEYLTRAELRLDRGDLAGAFTDANSALAADDSHAPAWILRADCYYRAEDYGAALANLRRAETLDAQLPRLFLVRALCYQRLSQDEDRDEAFEAARRLRVFQWELSYYLALLEFEKGNLDDASQWLSRCLRRNPNHKRARMLRAQLREHGGNYREMLDDLATALQLDPDWAEALRLRCRAYEALEEWQELEADTTRLLALEPQNAMACVQRAKARASQKQKTHALADLSRAISLRPERTDWRLRRAEILLTEFTKGSLDLATFPLRPMRPSAAPRHALAQRDLTAVLQLEPGNARAWLLQGQLDWQRGSWWSSWQAIRKHQQLTDQQVQPAAHWVEP